MVSATRARSRRTGSRGVSRSSSALWCLRRPPLTVLPSVRVSRSSSALWCLRLGTRPKGATGTVSRSSSALWCLRSATWGPSRTRAFLGALLLCGVCDGAPKCGRGTGPFLGALLLCGVCDQHPGCPKGHPVSRSSSALWCLRLLRRTSWTVFRF